MNNSVRWSCFCLYEITVQLWTTVLPLLMILSKKDTKKTHWGATHLIQEFVRLLWASQSSFLVVHVTKNLLIKLLVKVFKLLTKLLGNSEQLLIIWGTIHNCLTCTYFITLPSLSYWLLAYMWASAYGAVCRQLENTCSLHYWSEFL